MDLRDPEFQALLSAYAMGTLSAEERNRLFEKALGNQELFDALMEEQTMKDVLDHPLVRRSLLRAIEKVREEQPLFAAGSTIALELRAPQAGSPQAGAQQQTYRSRPPSMLWAAAAAALCLSAVLVYLFLPTTQNNAKPDLVAVQTSKSPEAALPSMPTPLVSEPKSRALPPTMKDAAPAIADPKEAENKAVQAPEKSNASESAPPAQEAMPQRKAEAPASPEAAANSFAVQPSSNALADSLEQSRSRSAIRQAAAPLNANAQILKENDVFLLRVSAPASGFLYAFAESGSGWRAISRPGDNIWAAGEQRSFPLGPLASGTEIRLILSPARDEELELALEIPRMMPQRRWTSLRVPR